MLRWTYVLCLVIVVGADVSRVIQLEQGPVRGYKEDGVFAFYSIPYATAPTGPNKYKAPLPPPTNREPLDAVEKGIICPQVNLNVFPGKKVMQEDCLIANVFVPDTENDKMPVMVEIHGGGFQIGFSNWMTPKHLIKTKNMIVVTFNYRLSVHGFLCLGTEDIPGNAGMKDQIALLRWVKNNIAAFGGNPDDVSIDGGSAGGSSVDLLMLSRAAKGLFKKVLPASGSSLAAFSIQSDPLENAKMFAKRFNFTNTENIYALEQFYKTTPLEQLIIDTFIDNTDSQFVFSPCVERNIGKKVFLDKDPLSILKNGRYEKVPVLIGFAKMEGLFRIDKFETWKNRMNEKFSDFLPADLKFKNEEHKQRVASEVKEFYFGSKPVSNDNVLSYVDYFSDVIFTYPAIKSVELHLKNGHDKVYLYEYSFTHDDEPVVPHTNVRGANHMTQLMAVMDGINFTVSDETNATIEYKNMKSVMREIWSNFVTTGKPVPEGSSLPTWPAVSENWSPYMSLGQPVELKNSLLEKRYRFWAKIYDKYYRTPIAPPVPPKRKMDLPPLPPPSWKGTFEAVDKKIICPQVILEPIIPADRVMHEDCLIANVFVPDTNHKDLPVYVIVHGGGFQLGYGNWITAKNLMQTKDMIVVTFNYRLGKHGFLCLGTKDAPGNAGMKDQVALLRWVKYNIAAFGGDPNDITLGGCSAGGTSVELLLISKSTKGLFHKVIPESAYLLSAFSIQPDPLEVAKTFAKRMNFSETDDLLYLEEFYKSAPMDLLIKDSIISEMNNSYFFSPCVEQDIGQEVFLEKDPHSMLKSGDYQKVPMLLGFTEMEGLHSIALFEQWKNGMNENFGNYLPPDLEFENEQQKNEITKQIKEFYFNDEPITNDEVLSFVAYISDIFFNGPTLRLIKLLVDNGHDAVYLYEHSFTDEDTPLVPHTDTRGATHCAQSVAVMDGTSFIEADESNITSEYKEVKSLLRELWANFITTGKPVLNTSGLPKWPPVGSHEKPYMSLGEKMELKNILLDERIQFWKEIYDKYYRRPMPPPRLHTKTEF